MGEFEKALHLQHSLFHAPRSHDHHVYVVQFLTSPSASENAMSASAKVRDQVADDDAGAFNSLMCLLICKDKRVYSLTLLCSAAVGVDAAILVFPIYAAYICIKCSSVDRGS